MSRPRFVRALTEAERRELAQLIHTGQDGCIVRQAQTMRLSAEGYETTEIAVQWDVSAGSISRH